MTITIIKQKCNLKLSRFETKSMSGVHIIESGTELVFLKNITQTLRLFFYLFLAFLIKLNATNINKITITNNKKITQINKKNYKKVIGSYASQETRME